MFARLLDLRSTAFLSVPLTACLSIPFVILFCSVAHAQKAPSPQPVTGKVDWIYSYDEGQAKALESNKPMFVVIRCER